MMPDSNLLLSRLLGSYVCSQLAHLRHNQSPTQRGQTQKQMTNRGVPERG